MLLTALAALLLLAAARPTLWSTPAQAQKDDTCQFKLSDTVAGFNSDGGKGTLGIYTNSKSCEWEAVTKDDFITIVSKTGGTGEGEVIYEVAANPEPSARKGTIYVADQTLTVVQNAPDPQQNSNQPPEPEGCVESLSPAEIDAPPDGTKTAVSVNAPVECEWTAKSQAAWLTLSDNAAGKGKGETSFTVAPNGGPTARLGSIEIGGQTLTVTQNSSLNLPIVKFRNAETDVQEGQTALLTVVREGATSGVSTVAYATADDFALAECAGPNAPANQRCDYNITRGTLTFQPGETEKSFEVLITNDAYSENVESLGVALVGATNANFGDQRTATLRLRDDNDDGSGQPLENVDFFVTQHYADFLSRKPDPGGLAYWTGEITGCGSNAACVSERRVAVSDAFFYEQEFQQTGAFVYRLYRASFGVTRPAYQEFMADRAQLTGQILPDLAAEKSALAEDFATRPEFLARYPDTMTGEEFLDALLHNIQKNSRVDLSAQTPTLLALYDLGGKALVVRELADERPDNLINNRAFIDAEYNPSFVLTQYFGYLRRDADADGYDFWLNVLNQYPLRNLTGQHAMVCAFITSAEYQHRFGPDTPRSNADCAP